MKDDLEQPRDELGKLLRQVLHCPACGLGFEQLIVPAPLRDGSRNGNGSVRVIAYRQHSIRLECRECGLRFSVDPMNFADVRARQMAPPPEMIEGRARQMAGGDPAQYLTALAAARQSAERFIREQRDRVVSLHRDGVKSAAPRKRPIRFPKR